MLQETRKSFGTIMTMWLFPGMLLNMLKDIRCIAVLPVMALTRLSQKTSPPSLGQTRHPLQETTIIGLKLLDMD